MTRPTVLVLLAHADPAVRGAYEEACRGLPATVVVRPFVAPGPGLSSAYERLAASLRGAGGRVLPALVQRYAAGVAFDHVVLAWWSGGYGLGRALADADRDELAGLVALDGLHTGLEADGTASDAGLEWIADVARRAKDGRSVCWVGHTDVPTPQKGPGAYASTTQTALELERLVGPSGGAWRLQAYDTAKSPTTEHVNALRGWGPAFVAGAVAEVLRQRAAAPDTDPTPAPVCVDEPGGMAALRRAITEMPNAIEVPLGSNGGPRIEEYFKLCVRGGKLVGLRRGEWCAAFASWCAWEAHEHGGAAEPPHERRVAVWELWADALEVGAARRPGEYIPQPGDLAILARGGGDPRKKGTGHVGRVESVDLAKGLYVTVDGNSGERAGRAVRSLDDKALVGWISYGARRCPEPNELALAAGLCALEDGVDEGIEAVAAMARRLFSW